MTHMLPQSTRNLLTSNRAYSPMYMLNDDALLNIFNLYRLDIRDEEEDENARSVRRWDRQRWWYRLAHVSRGWRSLILASRVQLNIHLLCTYGVPVADMLAYSPPLPLIIFYEDIRGMTTEDEEGALLALSHRGRIRRISFWVPASNLGKFITAMDEEFPILERMCLGSQSKDSTRMAFPGTFQAPNLRHVWTASIGSPLLTNTASLVNLELIDIPASAYFPPSYLLTRMLLMPQLETLVIHFNSPLPNRDVEVQLSNTLTAMPPFLHLHLVSFRGVSAYFEILLARISAPVLSKLDVQFFNRLIFTVPCLLRFMQTSQNFSFSAVELTFDKDFFDIMADPDRGWWQHPLRLRVICRHLDWQVSSAVQILSTLSPVVSVVDTLTLSHVEETQSLEWLNDIDRTQWRDFFRPFGSVKTLRVPTALVGALSRSLCSEDGESPLEILPNLLELKFPDGKDIDTAFVISREAAGHPVRLSVETPLQYPWSARRLNVLPTTLLNKPTPSKPPPSPHPFPRYGHALPATSTAAGELFLFGGFVRESLNNDLYVFSTRDLTASYLQTHGEIPSPRVGHAAALVSNVLLIWGGDINMDAQEGQDDSLYSLNLVSREWTQVPAYGPRPVSRYGHTVTMVGSKFFIFGGQVGGEFFNDIWAFDLNSLKPRPTWELYEPAPGKEKPPRRTGHAMVTHNNYMIIFGGTDGRYHYNDTWLFDISTREWTEFRCTGYIPSPREGHAAALVDDIMYVFGGRGVDGTDLGDLAAVNLLTQRWFMFQNMGTSPSGRSGHAMASIGTQVFVLGGESASRLEADQSDIIHVLDTKYIQYPKPDPNAIVPGYKNQLTRKSSTGLPSQDHTQQATSSSTGTKPTPVAASQQSIDNELHREIFAQDVQNQHPSPIDNNGHSSAGPELTIHESTLSPDQAQAPVHTASRSGPVQRLVKMMKRLRQARNKGAHADERG